MPQCHCEEQSDEAIRNPKKNGLPQAFADLRKTENLIYIYFTKAFETEPLFNIQFKVI